MNVTPSPRMTTLRRRAVCECEVGGTWVGGRELGYGEACVVAERDGGEEGGGGRHTLQLSVMWNVWCVT
jgi:hypothetical protein